MSKNSNTELATVVCVYKTGGKEFTPEYVERLYKGCMKNGAEKFLCLTDDESVSSICEILELESDLPGWWAKLEMFRLTEGKYLYLDLDTIVHKSIRHVLEYEHKFTALKDFNKKEDRLASGLLAWSGDYSELYTKFDSNLIPDYTPMLGGKLGDQAYISDTIQCEVQYFQELFPNLVSSYKWDTKQTRRLTPIVCYHGKPRPKDTGWKI